MMAAFFLGFGVFTILRPERVRAAMDDFADRWKKGSWHPYRMPIPFLRFIVGGVGIAGSALFAYIAYVALTR
jgi:glucose-6-phosphate isomerase